MALCTLGAVAFTLAEQRFLLTFVDRRTRENPAEAFEWRSEPDSATGQPEFADRILVVSAAFFNHRKSAANSAVELEIAQHQDRIAEMADIQRRIHRAYQPVLR
jgi:hypothetical protein